MDVLMSSEFAYFLLRWFHFLAGVMWIGLLWYFNFVQVPFFATELGGTARGAMVRGLVPTALWWFRWGAMFTFLTGWTIVIAKMLGGVPHNSPYLTLILTGGLMGTLMWANVWFVIWPNQRVVISNAETVAAGGQANPAAAGAGARAGLASRTNTLFSIPMLFFMGSASHFGGLAKNLAQGGGHLGLYWIVVLVAAAAVEYNCLAGKTDQKLAKPPVGAVVHAGLGLTAVLFIAAMALL